MPVPVHRRRFGDQLGVGHLIVLVEEQPGDEAGVEQPEVLGRKAQFVGLSAREVADVLAHGAVPGRVAAEVQLPRGDGVIDQAHALDPLPLRGLGTDVAAPLVVVVPVDCLAVLELLPLLGRLVAGEPAASLQPPGRVGEGGEEVVELLVRVDERRPVDDDLAALQVLVYGRASAATLAGAVVIIVVNMQKWLAPDDVDLMYLGLKETLLPRKWVVTFDCVPAGPGRVGVLGHSVLGRMGTDGSQLAGAVTATATSLPVAVTAGALWQYESPFEIRAGGEVMRVTGITGTSGPQTFTVVRSVNGIKKPHPAGALLRPATPSVVAL